VERDKSLDMALSQIEKQYGKGAIMRLGSDQVQKVSAIPTGALSLDLALGIGGVPRGRIVEIYGPESGGKCLPADTYLWTDHGLETVAELFERCGQAASCTSRVTDVSHLGVRMVNEQGELEPVTALTHNNLRPVVRITVRSGRTIEATHNHPLRVVDESGFIVWRNAGDIAAGDVVVSGTFGSDEAVSGGGLSEDEAILLGYLVAEGSLRGSTAIRFTNREPEVGGEFTAIMEQLFGATVKQYNDQEYVVHSKALRTRFAEEYGLAYVNAAGKTVPPRVRTAGAKAQRAFLSALFEGDGWIDTSSTVGYASASEQLAREVQLLLYGFGIPATLTPKWNPQYERDYWTVTVNSAASDRFIERIGFRSERRRAQVERNYQASPRDPQLENIPNVSNLVCALRDSVGGDREFDRIAGDLFRSDTELSCSRSRLARIVAWAEGREADLPPSGRAIVAYLSELADAAYTYEAVTTVEDGGLKPTFDVVLPQTHSFLANGVLSHNTTLSLHIIAEAQRNGGIAAFIDAEHALDPHYARALGVDVDELLISQPDTGEQALEIADMLIRSGALDVVVIDSVAALVPRAEIEGEMGDTHMGLQARLMSQALRKLAGTINRSDTTAVFINQIREKIGVMFGCLSYSTRVTLADGTQEKIGKIVNQRMDVEVLSYDADLGAVVPKRVTNWFDNGRTDEFLRFTVAKGGGNGRSQFAATGNHLVRTPAGWREAQELAVGDRVLQAVPHYLSDFQWEVLLGGLMGDGALSPTRSGHGARFRFGHGSRQVEYGDWKASLFSNVNVSRSANDTGATFWDVQPMPELAELRHAVYFGGKKVLSWDYLKRLTPLSLAIWYMDDAHFALRSRGKQVRTLGGSGRVDICVEAMEATSRARLVDHLADTWGIRGKLTERAGKAVLQFPTAETAKLQALIAPYVHPSMDYKLLPRFQGRFAVEPDPGVMRYELVPMPVTRIERGAPNGRQTHRFDIEVEGSHNYFVDGVMVHNSPETTPGGRALKFYSSVRIEVRRIQTIKEGQDSIGNRVVAKVVKNKVAPPFRKAEFDIMFGEGISREGSLLDVAVEEDVVRKSGAWYTYDDDQLGQGRENAKRFLRENPEVAMQLQARVLASVGLGHADASPPENDDEGSEEDGDLAASSDRGEDLAGSIERVDGVAGGDDAADD
jgi:recombination protein RecA